MRLLRHLRPESRPSVGRIVSGRPDIANHGSMIVGADVAVASSPVDTEIVVATSGRLTLGDRVRIGHGSSLHAYLSVEIGADVLIGPFVIVTDTDHHLTTDLASAGRCAPVVIERGARIGAHATVLRGAHVGAGAVVEPGSVVAGFVAAGARVTGNPAR